MTTDLAREYLRVSFDRSGRERSPEEQHDDNQRAADRHGWVLGEPYRDVGSASRYARKARADYRRLVDDLEHGRFGAGILILWESSRGSRKVSEWAALIETCQAAGVNIYVTSDGRLYDTSEPRDRRSLHDDAADAEYESGKTSKRVRRSTASGAASGRPGAGPPAYGFRRTYDPATGRMAAQEIDPAEAAVVREIYTRLNAGHSLRNIANDLEARGVMTRAGRPFTRHTIRMIALNRVNIAERVHDPKRQGRPYGNLSPVATVTPATWPAIVDRALWTAVHRRLTDPVRNTTRPARGVHWLSRIARCDVCHGPMQARAYRHPPPEQIYTCHTGSCVRVSYDDLNRYAEKVLLAYLARDDVAHKLTAQPIDPAAVAAVEDEIARIEQDIDDLADQRVAGGPAAQRLVDRALPGLEKSWAAARARRDELTAPSRLRGLIKPGPGVHRRWQAAPMAARREIAQIVFVPDLIGELRVTKGLLRDPIKERVAWMVMAPRN